MSFEDLRKKIIFALDVSEIEEAKRWVRLLKDHVGLFKVGSQLFTHVGPSIIDMIKQEGRDVFLDLKYHDTPYTVANACKEAVKLGVAMYDLHALGGLAMMRQAVSATDTKAREMGIVKPKVLAVTILTSMDKQDILDIGISHAPEDAVLKLALLGKQAGVDGVVAAPQEVKMIRENCGQDFIIVTPGIRTIKDQKDDQKRTLTPDEALRMGADFMVIGRPIRHAKDPLKVIENILKDMEVAQCQKSYGA
ncbi:MAG TPA: orotidine-5'-phosphate decarboxylase [Syntrophaceae bacterium]|nr:orotidine-5'-phosphate decarboxylase [Syntrophaceae bacterium]